VLAVVGVKGVLTAVKVGSKVLRGGLIGAETAGAATREVVTFAEGSFSIIDWSHYPAGMPKPSGPFVLLQGKEYTSARAAANGVNKSLHSAEKLKYAGKQIHEIHPVKFGGDPTGLANKIALPIGEHQALTAWWNRLQIGLESN
jgi:hypothetical protein